MGFLEQMISEYEGNSHTEPRKEQMKFRFVKAGDVLRYGMIYELPEIIRNKGEGEAKHLYTLLTFLVLSGYLDVKKALAVPERVIVESLGEESLENVVKMVSNIIFCELKDKFEFITFNELKEQLDELEIPRWCFDQGENILNHYIENMVLNNDWLYFIGKRENDTECSLLKVNVNNINEEKELIETYGINGLASGFTHICGFDAKLQRIYLTMYDQTNYYAYYDILSDKVVICRNRFHSFVSDNLFVVTRDNHFAIVLGDKEYKINKFYEWEKYEGRKGYFFVTPSGNIQEKFFFPYYLFFDGKKTQAEKKEHMKVLWEYMIFKMKMANESPFSRNENSADCFVMPSVFSIDEIRGSLDAAISRENRCQDMSYVLLLNIFNLLEPYVGKNKEITRLLYALCEADSLINSYGNGFPSDKLYWRLKEIDIENKDEDNSLPALLKDYNYELLIKEITNEVNSVKEDGFGENEEAVLRYSLFESSRYNGSFSETHNKIGTFVRTYGNIQSHTIALEEGIFLGAQLIPKMNLVNENGLITYDSRAKFTYITCEYDLSSAERLQIIKDFSLDSNRIMVVKQGKSFEYEE